MHAGAIRDEQHAAAQRLPRGERADRRTTGTWEWEEKQGFLCECAAGGCTEAIWLTRAEYEGIRAEQTHFVAVAGHERAEEERVVGRNDGYVVVERF